MKTNAIKALQELRHEGYAVIIWTPEELKGANPRRVEDRSIELGYEVICDLTDLEEVAEELSQ